MSIDTTHRSNPMSPLLSAYVALRHREEGQTMIEYAMVLALIVLTIAGVIVLTDIEGTITDIFTDTNTELQSR